MTHNPSWVETPGMEPPEAAAVGVTRYRVKPRKNGNGVGAGVGIPEMSDEALALKFADLHSSTLRYTNKWGKWHYFDGKYWRPEETLLPQDFARKLCREFAVSAHSKAARNDATRAKKSTSVLNLARTDRRLAATVEQWDTNPWLLNTPNGTHRLEGTANPRA